MSAYKLFDKAFRINNLNKVYKERIQDSTAVGLDKIGRDKFREEYKSHTAIISKKAKNNTYHFTPYKKKLISKGENKKPRVISIPTFRDRVTLRVLCNIFSELYETELKLDIPQVKIEHINANIKKNTYDSYIKIDITNFYPSINHEILINTLKKKIKKAAFINLVKKAIKNKTVSKSKKEVSIESDTGVPQGLSISNILAEIYISHIDKKYLGNKDIFYIRYVDDILIFCKSDYVEELFKSIKDDFDAISLEMHELNKTDSKCQSGDINDVIHFLGYRYENRIATIIPTNKQKFEDSIANLLTTFKYRYNKATDAKSKTNAINVLQWRINLKITGCIFEKRKRGWMFYFSQIEDLNTLYSIDKTISKLVHKLCPEKITIKTLVKAYHETQRLKTEQHKYITNFDKLTASDKKEILELYLGFDVLSHADEDTINRYFKMRITQIIQELEQDIGNLS